jgi:DNA-binding transcriptional LysR family regulator
MTRTISIDDQLVASVQTYFTIVQQPPPLESLQREPPLLQLSTQQLHYLTAVARSATWALAAAELGVTPSALSQGLAELERRLGLSLFERDGRRRVLSPAAGEVVAYAERVVASTRELGRWVESVRLGTAGRLRIGMIDAAAVAHYPATLADFRRSRPDVDLRLTVGPSGPLLAQLRAAELDLAVVVDPPPPTDDLVLTPLLAEDLALYAPAGRHALPPSQWGPFVLFPAGSHTRATIVSSLQALGATVDIVAESHQPEVLRTMVDLGLGWTVLPVAQAESGDHPLVRARPEPIASRRLVAARRRDAAADPVVDALIATLTT